jgi:trehalose 6-phosphate phosphatase
MHWREATDTLLKEFVSKRRMGVVSDVDGTLSPIVDDPAAAIVLPASKQHLTAMQPKLELLAFVSGRSAADIHGRVGIADAVYVGNHGMEKHLGETVQINNAVAAYRPNLEAIMDAVREGLLPGMALEDKGATASVHYRRTENPQQTAATFKPQLEKLGQKHNIHIHSGKMVFELRPPVDVNKGTAFRDLIADYRLDAAMYLGDDVTDADAMRAAGELRAAGACFALGVGVQHTGDTPAVVERYADVMASSVEDVAALLGWLENALTAS